LSLLWIAPYFLFNLYWAPEDVQFWTPILPPWLLILGLALHRDRLPEPSSHRRLPTSLLLATCGLAAALAVNLLLGALPRADAAANPNLAKTACAAALTRPEDLVVSPGWDWASGYLPYFAGRTAFSIVDVHLSTAGGDRARTLALFREEVRAAADRRGAVYVFRLYDLPADERAWFERTTGLRPEDFDQPRAPAGACLEETVWRLTP
jgi:hypothetical protein